MCAFAQENADKYKDVIHIEKLYANVMLRVHHVCARVHAS